METHGQDYVRLRAQELWENAGRPEGRDLDFWLMAERMIAIEETADDGPVSEIDTVRRTLETPPDPATGLSPPADPKGGQLPAGGSDLVDQRAGGKNVGTGKNT
jgi:hypothetical protein